MHPLYGELKITPKESGYSRGKEGYEQILYAALNILMESGYKAITFRKIATDCDMNVGNVSYYFSSKETLIRELLDAIIGHYEDEFDKILSDMNGNAESQLYETIKFIVEDLTTKKTTRIFPELWALSNHDAFIARRVEALYRRARLAFHKIILSINPSLPAKEREIVALFLSASIEGLTVFSGYKKPWTKSTPELVRITYFSHLNLIKHITAEEISKLQKV